MKYFMIGGDGREYGPVDAETIRQWVRENRANGDTLLRMEGETDLKPLRAFADFEREFQPPPVPTGIPEFFTRPNDVPVRVGHAFARAWHLVAEHFGSVAGATLLVWMAFTAMLYAPCSFGVLAMVFYGPLFGGLFMFFLKLIREGEAAPGEVFTLTRDCAMPLILAGLINTILTQIATCCCVIPGIYLAIAWLFSLPLVADRGMNFWDALETSRRVATSHWFKLFALFLLSFLPFVVFHFYIMSRMGMDISPYMQKLIGMVRDGIANGNLNQAEVQKVAAEVDAIERSYGLWFFFRQLLLLVSLPFGIGSLAFVYEDLFGRKR